MKLVYCSKCGAKNKDDAKICTKCGGTLYPLSMEKEIERKAASIGKEIERKADTCFGPRKRRKQEEECFGLPRGGTIVGIVIGLIIIFAGISWMLSHYYDISIEIWPIAVIIFGILILAGALYGMRRE